MSFLARDSCQPCYHFFKYICIDVQLCYLFHVKSFTCAFFQIFFFFSKQLCELSLERNIFKNILEVTVNHVNSFCHTGYCLHDEIVAVNWKWMIIYCH